MDPAGGRGVGYSDGAPAPSPMRPRPSPMPAPRTASACLAAAALVPGVAGAVGHLDAPLWVPDPAAEVLSVEGGVEGGGGTATLTLSACLAGPADREARYSLELAPEVGAAPLRYRLEPHPPGPGGSLRWRVIREAGPGPAVPLGWLSPAGDPTPLDGGGTARMGSPPGSPCHGLFLALPREALPAPPGPAEVRASVQRRIPPVRATQDPPPERWADVTRGGAAARVVLPPLP